MPLRMDSQGLVNLPEGSYVSYSRWAAERCEDAKMIRSTWMLFCALLATALSGCVIYDDDHHHFHDGGPACFDAELRISWEFDRAFNCRDAGVTDILIQVEGGGRIQEFGYIACESGFAEIPRDFPTAGTFVPGSYFVTVLGFPPRGGATWIAESRIDLFCGFNDYTFVLNWF